MSAVLKFHPMMTLQAAARIAHTHGRELRVRFNGTECEVIAVKPLEKMEIPSFLLHPMQAGG